jgi:hypothetical protein
MPETGCRGTSSSLAPSRSLDDHRWPDDEGDEDNTVELPSTNARIDKQVPTDVVGGWCGAKYPLPNGTTSVIVNYAAPAGMGPHRV